MRYFWGSHQRCFRDLCIASKVPTIVAAARAELAAGKCVVIGLQSTGEARAAEAVELFGDEFEVRGGLEHMEHRREGVGRRL